MPNGQIPSGGAPLFLGDLATPTAAIGQRMTQRLIDKNKADQTRRGKERTAMLEAMSFSAVEGLSQKLNMEHLREFTAVGDKWAEIWLSNGKKLTDQNYLELEQDKRKLQQSTATKKHNVAQFAWAQNQLTTNPYAWESDGLGKLTAFKEAGNVGADASQILTPRYDTLGALKKGLRGIKLDEKKTFEYVGDKRMSRASTMESANTEVDRFVANDPNIQRQIQNNDPNVAGEIQSMKDFLGYDRPTEAPLTATDIKERAMAGAIDKYKDDTQAQLLLARDVPIKDIPVAKAINNSLHKLIQGDAATIESLHGTSKWGFIDKAERRPNGDIRIMGKADKNGERPEKTFYVSEAKSEAQKRMLMETMVDIGIPDIITGKEQPKNILNTLIPSGWDVEPGKTGLPILYETRVGQVVGGEKITTNQATDLLSDLYPEKVKAKERTWMGSTKLAKDGIIWNDKEYVWKKDGSKELLNDVAEEFGYEIPFPELSDSEAVAPKELPVITSQEEYDKLKKGDKYEFEGNTLIKE